MKIKITFKDPDGVGNALDESVRNSLLPLAEQLSKQEFEQLVETRLEEVGDKIAKWIEYGEYLTVEIDTDTDTATVKRV